MENTKLILKSTKSEKEYILEYNRETIQQMEKLGFAVNEIEQKPMTMLPLMFRGAFLKNHKYIKEKEITEIYDNIKNKEKLHNQLIEMIGECYETLLSDNNKDTEGNADWEIV